MGTNIRLAEPICMEVFGARVVRLIEGGNAVPVVWSNSLSITDEDQTTIDIHLLYGSSDSASNNHSIGRWRIVKIPLFEKGKPDIDVEININEDGRVVVAASISGWPLKVMPVGVIKSVPVEQSM